MILITKINYPLLLGKITIKALKINKLDPSIFVLIANTYYMNNEVERSINSYRAAVNLRPENDEYKLVFIQVLEDFLKDSREGDIVANF